MTTEVETGVRPAHLLEYNKRALKLVGIGKDGKPSMKWGPIYDNPNYWTDEELVRHAPDFKYGVATVFGLTRLSDEQGPLYVNNLIVMQYMINCSSYRIQGQNIHLSKDFLKKVSKGHQIYWYSHKQHKPIHTQDCKKGFKFEIHTDKSSGTGMLPPSRHRDDANFEYTLAVGGKIPTSDAYDIILEVLGDCLISRPEKQDCLIPGKDDSGGEQNLDLKRRTKRIILMARILELN